MVSVKMIVRIFALPALMAGLVFPWKNNSVFADNPRQFSFVITADIRKYAGPGYDSSNYFRGVMEAIKDRGGGAFMLSLGDIDPVEDVQWTIEQVLGPDYLWFPITGNHELPGDGFESDPGENMDILRGFDYDRNGFGIPPDIINTGPSGCPETTFAFDFENAHFVVLNEYCDETGDHNPGGTVSDHLYDWLVSDLKATAQKHIFVFGHEPAFPQPDADNGRIRHLGDSLDADPINRDRFWRLLRDEGVLAYFCGHSHNFSVYYNNGVWQLDAGHSRGAGDTGVPSTFLMIRVDGNTVTFDAYRDAHDGVYDYNDVIHSGTLYDGNIKPPVLFHFLNGWTPEPGYIGMLDTDPRAP